MGKDMVDCAWTPDLTGVTHKKNPSCTGRRKKKRKGGNQDNPIPSFCILTVRVSWNPQQRGIRHAVPSRFQSRWKRHPLG